MHNVVKAKYRMNNVIKISIIIPIYNAANNLEGCLESVRCQSFQGYEVWLLQEGSTDRAGAICDRFAAEDARFHVIHKANGGASAARNVGIEQAQGEWICFVDSDDTVEPDYLSALYSYAQHPEILVPHPVCASAARGALVRDALLSGVGGVSYLPRPAYPSVRVPVWEII